MLMMRPQRCFSMEPMTAWISRNGPVRLVLSTSSQSARFMRMTNWSWVTPALFTRMSILPKRAIAAFTPALISSSLPTSILNAAASPPLPLISPASCSIFSWLRAQRASLAPASASTRAQARPIPCDAPVTSATRPSTPAMKPPEAKLDYKYLELCLGLQQPLRRPEQHLQLACEVSDFRLRWERDPRRLCHGVFRQFNRRLLQLPGKMMDFAAVEALAVIGVQAITLSEEMFKRARSRMEHLGTRPVRAAQFGGLRSVLPLGNIFDPGAAPAHQLHGSLPVRQAIKHARTPHRRQIAGVQAKEIHAGFPVARDVGAHVDFGKMREPWQRGHSRRPQMIDPEWRDRHPRALLVSVEREHLRHERANHLWRQSVVQEQQVVPALGHDPRRHRRRPGAMRGGEQNRIGPHPPGPALLLLRMIGLFRGSAHLSYGRLPAAE